MAFVDAGVRVSAPSSTRSSCWISQVCAIGNRDQRSVDFGRRPSGSCSTARVCMQAGNDGKTEADSKAASSLLTHKAELLNGRVAMIGFLIGVLTQAINPNHPTFVQQLTTSLPARVLSGLLHNSG
mmetsp:Transcript_3007/g.6478  ORF Transcript_3007/g.6478 Transcript_3007/m.6478 type:complete len:126 (-) Transcript_3007:87-464(-)